MCEKEDEIWGGVSLYFGVLVEHAEGSNKLWSLPMNKLPDKKIDQFCVHHQMGRTTYFKLRKAGLGPDEVRVGRFVRITAQAEQEWVERMQALNSVLFKAS